MAYSSLNIPVKTATVAKEIARHRGLTLTSYFTSLIEADARAFSLAGSLYGFSVNASASGSVVVCLDGFSPRICTVAEARSFATHLVRVARFGGVLADFDAPRLTLGRQGTAITIEDSGVMHGRRMTISPTAALEFSKNINAVADGIEASGDASPT